MRNLLRAPRRADGRTTRSSRDRGALSLELAVLFPVVMIVIFTLIESALWFHARNVALTAAQRGVETARLQNSSLGDGATRARAYLDKVGGGSLRDASVSTSGGATVTVTVTGRVDTWIPGLTFSVRQHASAPKERVTQP
ncbi:TadE family protein [Kitasatospora sp. NPDC056783]|uniref:TadE family protein n=1 Tax=Kitasatospora sp. NPDC056783 TaxID=3345943 RepID=UPI0036ABF983